jgi:folate-dependent tRNA-U54 methylase TrmFO/GidA
MKGLDIKIRDKKEKNKLIAKRSIDTIKELLIL